MSNAATLRTGLPTKATVAETINRSGRIAVAILALGTILRLNHYLGDRALWGDEAMLASNFTGRDLGAMLQGLATEHQMAPFGFLLLEKFVVDLFGDSGYALRLIPLLAGLATLGLLYLLLRHITDGWTLLFVLFAAAISRPLIYFSSEVKQYGLDAAVALGLLLLTWRLLQQWSPARIALLAGAGAVWLSHPAIFVLAGIGTTLAVQALHARAWRRLGQLCVAAVFWLASFAIAYKVIKDYAPNVMTAMTQVYWASEFAPFPPRSAADLRWFADHLLGIFAEPGGFKYTVLAALLFFFGVVEMARRASIWLSLLLAPLGFAIVASALHLYPFTQRFLLFAAPALLILVGAGLAAFHRATWRRAPWMVPVLAGVLFLHPMYWALSEAARASPYEHENVRAALRYVIDHRQAGDVIFVHRTAQANMRFYAPRLGLAESAYRQGAALPSDWPAQQRELDSLIGAPRAWILFAKRDTRVYAGVEERFLAYADERGARRATFLAPGASAYLYDFTVVPPAPDVSRGSLSAR